MARRFTIVTRNGRGRERPRRHFEGNPCEPRERSGSAFSPRRSHDGVALELLGDVPASVAAALPGAVTAYEGDCLAVVELRAGGEHLREVMGVDLVRYARG